MTFKLSASLVGSHTQDIKAVTAVSNDSVYSGSRDSTVVKWSAVLDNSESPVWVPSLTLTEHTHFVNALTFVPPSEQFPNGLIVSAGSDKTILVYDASNPLLPIFMLIGHESNVCSLGTTKAGNILSGSWDYTARVWNNGINVFTVKHPHTVWAILGIESGDKYITACADKIVRLYDGEKLIHNFIGHNEAVRGLTETSTGFASCSNDGVIRLWALSGEALQELHGHTSFIYTIVSSPDKSLIYSGGEDKTVRIWKDGKLIQTIDLPTQSIWSVDSLPNGDIVLGGSDGKIRIFTQESSRFASPADIEEFEKELASQTISSNMVGDLKTNDLSGIEALAVPGKSDGATQMIKNDGKIEVYSWSQVESSWTKIGDVVDAVGSSRKASYEGKDYDYVFDIDIGDGIPALKLPFNVTENPYQAAQDFIWKHELPQSYLDTIADFIMQNAQGVTLGSSTGYQDPFTASRYIPGGN